MDRLLFFFHNIAYLYMYSTTLCVPPCYTDTLGFLMCVQGQKGLPYCEVFSYTNLVIH